MRAGGSLGVCSRPRPCSPSLEVIAATLPSSGVAGWSWQDALDAFVVTNCRDRDEPSASAARSWPGIVRATRSAGCSLAGWRCVMRRAATGSTRYGAAAASRRAHRMAVQRLALITIFVWSWPLVHRARVSRSTLAAVSRRTPANPPLAVGLGDCSCDRYGTALHAWRWAPFP